jgi:hypothetical protein
MAMNKTKTIDGIEFSVAPFMAVEALRLKAFLLRTFGPALGQMIGTLKNVLTQKGELAPDMQIDGDSFSKTIETLTTQLDEDSFVNLIKRMFANLVAKGKDKAGKGFARQFDEKNFDNSFNFVFQGRIFSIYPILLLVLEANYPDFFEKTVRSIGRLTKEMSSSEPGDGTETEKSSNSETSEN